MAGDHGNLRINEDRLWGSLMELAEIGATAKGGVARLALTEEDKRGRDLFMRWCEEAGLQTRIDRMGNIFARRPGRNPSARAVASGSHLDSQPTGGKFDGAYGVLAALEVIRTLNDHAVETEAPVEIAAWTNEEGVRFSPAMVGAGVYGGAFTLDYALGRKDADGVTLGQALEHIGYAGPAMDPEPFGAFLEVHIEQGPVLENAGLPIGIVEGVQGIRWYDLTLTGSEVHAGPTPMDLRRDPLRDGLPILQAIYDIAYAEAPEGRATIGVCQAHPGSRNTVPGQLAMSVDLRHPEAGVLARMDGKLRALAEQGAPGLTCKLEEVWHSPPVKFDSSCVAAVTGAAERLGLQARPMTSGAGHDSVYVARVAPTAMIFIPCTGGISHNEAEEARKDHVAQGTDVLLHALLTLAG